MTTPYQDQLIVQVMRDYKCTEELATQMVLLSTREWEGDVVETDPLNGRETPLRSEPLIEKVEG